MAMIKIKSDSINERKKMFCVDAETKRECDNTKIKKNCVDAKTKKNCGDAKIKKMCIDAKLKKGCIDAKTKRDCIDAKIKKDCVDAKTKRDCKDCVNSKIKKDCVDAKIKRDSVDAKIKEDNVDAKIQADYVDAKTKRDCVDVNKTKNRCDEKTDANCFSNYLYENNSENHEMNRNEVKPEAGSKKLVYDPTSLHYDMSGAKLMYIFNHYEFQDFFYTSRPATRDGTEQDVMRLQRTFGNIGFNVAEPCHDYTQKQIFEKLEDICNDDHMNTSCIITVILTHGDGGGMVLAADMTYQLSHVVNRILKEPSLAGKPKLFFIQACRGSGADSGHRISIDSGRTAFVIPTHADYLVIRSSFEEYVSFRSSNGSWMIQALCDVVDEYHEGSTFLDMTTLINRKVSQNTSSAYTNLEYREKKQMPEVWSTLTKHLNLYSEY